MYAGEGVFSIVIRAILHFADDCEIEIAAHTNSRVAHQGIKRVCYLLRRGTKTKPGEAYYLTETS